MKNQIPNFFIVGAVKAGTTALCNFFEQHPDVLMCPIKEPFFFAKDLRLKNFSNEYQEKNFLNVTEYLSKPELKKKHIAFIESEADYKQLYRDRDNQAVVGEASAGYLYSKIAAKEIFEFNSASKIIMILRNPVDRAFSHWLMDFNAGDVTKSSFLEAVREDQESLHKGWGKSHLYIELGLYYEQVKRFMDIFPSEQLHIVLYDDFVRDPQCCWRSMLQFLNLSYYPVDLTQRYNQARINKYPLFYSWIKKITKNFSWRKKILKKYDTGIQKLFFKLENQKIDKKERQELRGYFESDTAKLSALIKRDLTLWV